MLHSYRHVLYIWSVGDSFCHMMSPVYIYFFQSLNSLDAQCRDIESYEILKHLQSCIISLWKTCLLILVIPSIKCFKQELVHGSYCLHLICLLITPPFVHHSFIYKHFFSFYTQMWKISSKACGVTQTL